MKLSLPKSEWPAVDRDMWEALTRDGNPLDDLGAIRHLRSTSLSTLAERYGRWIGWLVQR